LHCNQDKLAALILRKVTGSLSGSTQMSAEPQFSTKYCP